MITNKDISIENGNIILNGDKYPLDGQSPATIMGIVKDNSDTTPTENSTAPITSGGVYTALGAKQDTLTFDNAPTASSNNPVKSGGIYSAINDLISVVQPANESVTVTGPYSDITFTPPVETGYTFYLIGAVAINLSGWNMSNINPVAGSIRIYATDTTAASNQVKTTWLKIKTS